GDVGVARVLDGVAVEDGAHVPVAGGPVRHPAVVGQSELVVGDEVGGAGLGVGVGVGRVALDLGVDAGLGQALLDRLDRVDLGGTVGAHADVDVEAVGVAALLHLLLGLLHAGLAGGGRVGVVGGVGAGDVRGQHLGGDLAAQFAAVGALDALAADRVLDGLAAGEVVQRLDLGVDVEVEVGAGGRVVEVGAGLLVTDQLALHRRAQAGAGQVDVEFAVDQALVDLVLLDALLDGDAVGQRGADGVGLGVPLLVADQDEAVAGRVVVLELVRAGGADAGLVLLALVGVGGDGGGLRLGEDVEEVRERLLEVEDQGVVVGGLDGVEALQRVAAAVGAVVVVLVEQLLEVLGAVGQRLVAEVAARDGVLDVLGDDLGAVLVLEALLDLHGPLGTVVADLGHLRGQVGNQFGARLAGGRRVGQQGAGVVAAEVPDVAVVGVARVGALHVGGDGVAQGAAGGVGGVDDLGAA